MLCGCNTPPPSTIVLGKEPKHFLKEGLTKVPQDWEDGFRTSMEPGTFEWWYFDGHTEDGLYVIIVFYKNFTGMQSEPVPFVSVRINYPDGKKVEYEEAAPLDQVKFSTENTDFKIGKSWVKGNLNRYDIHVESASGHIKADLTLESKSRPWRPGTGFWYFGDSGDEYYAWLVAVPHGELKGNLNINGNEETFSGIGYHDHNWGNVELGDVWHHWWWSRAHFDDKTFIAAYLVSDEKFAYEKFPMFLLMDEGEILMEDLENVSMTTEGMEMHPVSNKGVEKNLIFESHDGAHSAKLKLLRKKDLTTVDLLDIQPWYKAALARLLGIDPWYYRFYAGVELETHINGEINTYKNNTLLEFMELGKTKESQIQ